jgi:hypothetical protein
MKAELLEETYGFSDCEHVKNLIVLRSVMCATYKRKIGRGKNARFVDEYKWNSREDKQIRENINYSIKIFAERCSSTESTNGK